LRPFRALDRERDTDRLTSLRTVSGGFSPDLYSPLPNHVQFNSEPISGYHKTGRSFNSDDFAEGLYRRLLPKDLPKYHLNNPGEA